MLHRTQSHWRRHPGLCRSFGVHLECCRTSGHLKQVKENTQLIQCLLTSFYYIKCNVKYIVWLKFHVPLWVSWLTEPFTAVELHSHTHDHGVVGHGHKADKTGNDGRLQVLQDHVICITVAFDDLAEERCLISHKYSSCSCFPIYNSKQAPFTMLLKHVASIQLEVNIWNIKNKCSYIVFDLLTFDKR